MCAMPADVKAQGAGPSGQKDHRNEVGGPVASVTGEGWERAAVRTVQGEGWGPTARHRHPSMGAEPVPPLSCGSLPDRWHPVLLELSHLLHGSHQSLPVPVSYTHLRAHET